MKSRLLIARKPSKGAVTVSETGASNAVVVPPGLYDVEIFHGITGGGPTVTVEIVEGTGGAPATSLKDARTRVILATADRWFFRGVRITAWDGAINAGVKITVAGGAGPTTANFGAVFHPMGRAPQFRGTP